MSTEVNRLLYHKSWVQILIHDVKVTICSLSLLHMQRDCPVICLLFRVCCVCARLLLLQSIHDHISELISIWASYMLWTIALPYCSVYCKAVCSWSCNARCWSYSVVHAWCCVLSTVVLKLLKEIYLEALVAFTVMSDMWQKFCSLFLLLQCLPLRTVT